MGKPLKPSKRTSIKRLKIQKKNKIQHTKRERVEDALSCIERTPAAMCARIISVCAQQNNNIQFKCNATSSFIQFFFLLFFFLSISFILLSYSFVFYLILPFTFKASIHKATIARHNKFFFFFFFF